MNTRGFYAALLAGLSLLANNAEARPVDLSTPSGELGAANSRGYLEIWREVEDMGLSMGKDSFLPLRYKFSSEASTGGILGPGFYVPMFEAKNVLIREQMMRAYLPCGKGLYLRRDVADPNKFQTVDQEWTAYLGSDGDLTVWRDDGWKLLYHKSRLTSLITDDNHTFTWDYTPTGMPVSVSEDGHPIITVEPNLTGQVAAFVFNGKRYEVAYADRPITQILLGQVSLKELDQALSSFKYPDGKIDSFKFVLTPERVPTLTYANRDGEQILYTWDPNTAYIATEKSSEGNWNYKIGAATQAFELPSISRTRNDGKYEGMSVDNKMGIYKSQAMNGMTTITYTFRTPGPLYGKVQKIEKVSGNRTTLFYRASYDEAGRLIRKLNENGIMTVFQYDNEGHLSGRHTSLSPDPVLLKSLATQEQVLLDKLKNSKDESAQQAIIRMLETFYVTKTLDFDKAAGLLKIMKGTEAIYNLKLDLASSNPNMPIEQRNAMLAQLVQEFPEKKAYTENWMIKKETE